MGIIPQGEPLPTPDTHHWTYRRAQAGILMGPYLIGAPSWGCETHHIGDRSIPCYAELPNCKLPCPHCPKRCQWTQYVPLIDCTGAKPERIVITGGTKTRGDTLPLRPGAAVKLSRGPGQTDTVRVSVWPVGEPCKVPLTAAGLCMVDITPYLLHLWQQRELTEHYGQRFYRARGRRREAPPAARKLPPAIPSPAADIAAMLAAGMKME